jgi:hypothetical protein
MVQAPHNWVHGPDEDQVIEGLVLRVAALLALGIRILLGGAEELHCDDHCTRAQVLYQSRDPEQVPLL